jgi:hypothetical protein
MAAAGQSGWPCATLNAAEESDIVVRKTGDILMRKLATAQVSITPGDRSGGNLQWLAP